MSENLGNFLVDLACNPDLMAQFIGDRAAVLAESPLSENERALMMARDPRLLSAALGTTAYAVGQIVDGGRPARRGPARKKKTPRKPPAKKAPPKKTPRKKAPARPARKRR